MTFLLGKYWIRRVLKKGKPSQKGGRWKGEYLRKNISKPGLPLRRAGLIFHFYPRTQETTALALEECVTLDGDIPAIPLARFGGFRCRADDPTKPWCLQTDIISVPIGEVGYGYWGPRACPWGSFFCEEFRIFSESLFFQVLFRDKS